MKVDYAPSKRYAEYVRKITCGEWRPDGLRGNDKAVLRHTSGATVAYGLHDGGNEWNGPRNFAAEVQRICGCQLIEPRGRKRSRKSAATAVDPEVEASRRRHAERYEARLAEREAARQAEMDRRVAAERAAADDRRRREIEELMR